MAAVLATLTAFARSPVQYQASAGCPDQAAFSAQLRAQTARSRGPDEAQEVRAIRVVVDGSGEVAVGRLSIVEPSGEVTTREVSGRTCAQVVDALALVAALAIDPDVLSAPRQPPALPSNVHPTPDRERAADRTVEAVPTRSQRRWRLSGAAHAEVTGAVPPGLALAVPLFVELDNEPVGPIPPGSRSTFSMRLGFERSFGASISTQPGSARFAWTVASFDSCGAWEIAKRLTAGSCAGVEVGLLQAKGASIAHPVEASRPWIGLAAMLRGRWLALPPLFLELEAGGVFPLWRDTFVFEPPRTVVYAAQTVGPRAGAGLGALFP